MHNMYDLQVTVNDMNASNGLTLPTTHTYCPSSSLVTLYIVNPELFCEYLFSIVVSNRAWFGPNSHTTVILAG